MRTVQTSAMRGVPRLVPSRNEHRPARPPARDTRAKTAGAPAAAVGRTVAAGLHDGDLVRWLGSVALVRLTVGADAAVHVRPLAVEQAVLGYSNRQITWDSLQTPVHQLLPGEEVEVLVTRAAAGGLPA